MSETQLGRLVAIVGRDIELAGTKSVEWDQLDSFESLDNFNGVAIDCSSLGTSGVTAAEALSPRSSEIARILSSAESGGPALLIFGWDSGLESIIDIVPRACEQSINNFQTQADQGEIKTWLQKVGAIRVGFDGFRDSGQTIKDGHRVRGVIDEVLAATPSGLSIALTYYMSNLPEDPLDFLLQDKEVWVSRRIVLLPCAPSRALDQAFVDVISSTFALQPADTQPEWISQIPDLPEQTAAENRIVRLANLRSRLDRRLKQAQDDAADTARFKQLFTRSGDELIDLVDEALALLGASCSYPDASHRVDVQLHAPDGVSYATEVKGVNRNVNESDFRQLWVWVDELSEIEPEIDWNGLLILNTFRKLPPSERDQPIHPNVVLKFQGVGFRFLSTANIYQALIQRSSGDFDMKAWWGSLKPPT